MSKQNLEIPEFDVFECMEIASKCTGETRRKAEKYIYDFNSCLQKKSFNDYAKEYTEIYKEDDRISIVPANPKYWDIRNKLGLLWYIIPDKVSNKKYILESFVELMETINHTNRYGEMQPGDKLANITTPVREIYEMLPKSFIESFEKH